MRFYTVSDGYIDFLAELDGKVARNADAGYRNGKLYVGVVLEIGSHRFLAPLSSYKQSQDRIPSSRCSAFKLHERGDPSNRLGLISFNYMVPAPEDQIAELDVAAQEGKYRAMLHKQYEFMKASRAEIVDRAGRLYEHVVIKRTPFYVNISCDIPGLVDRYKDYGKADGEAASVPPGS